MKHSTLSKSIKHTHEMSHNKFGYQPKMLIGEFHLTY
jgi:hypothetical protein